MAKLKLITCSGANEFTSVAEMVGLSQKFPMIEWGIQVSGKKCSIGTDRFNWLREVQDYLHTNNQKLQLALHVNADWVDGFDSERVSPELHMLLRMKDSEAHPLFRRVQLNFKIGRDQTPDEELLKLRLEQYGQNRRFILSFNPENHDFIHQLYRSGLRNFDVLYDSSHGEGIKASNWQKPAFFDDDILQGYAGGLSPKNVGDEIAKIKKVLPYNRDFYIDAEGLLKGADKHLSLEKCEQYAKNALQSMNM